MVRKLSVAAVAALVVMAQGCARKPEARAETGAVQALLASAWSGDTSGFEAVIDRTALRADLRQQLLQVAQANMLAVEGGASDAALDRMITPFAFRLVEAHTGAPLTRAPSRAQTAALLKSLGKDRVCLHDQTPQQLCLLTFARVKDVWRLVAMAPAGFTIPVTEEPQGENS
ncbi:hypothetical protein LJR219_000044 [Phenylobacterium sp. LjRoot219]|uniref:hypothetical protein n=1 Tax=Phenylobacterium sp. LjRoot219 TaxID=3342283 RepID=UPI003ECC3791